MTDRVPIASDRSTDMKIRQLINLVETYSTEFKSVNDSMADSILDLETNQRSMLDDINKQLKIADDNIQYLDERITKLEALRDGLFSVIRDIAAEHEVGEPQSEEVTVQGKSLEETLAELKGKIEPEPLPDPNPPIEPVTPPVETPPVPPVEAPLPGYLAAMPKPTPHLVAEYEAAMAPAEEPPKDLELVEIDALIEKPAPKHKGGFLDKILNWADRKLEEPPKKSKPKEEPHAPDEDEKPKGVDLTQDQEFQEIVARLERSREKL